MRLVYTPPQGYSHVRLKYGPYSASRLIVARCPARFESKYINREKIVSDSLAASRGSAVHYIFERIDRMKAENKVPGKAHIEKWLEEAIGLFPAAYPQIKLVMDATNAYLANPSPYTNFATVTEKELAVALYVEDSFVDDVEPNRVYVQVPYTVDGRPNSEVFLGAKIDKLSIDEVTKTITVLDHKTTPSASESEDFNFQMGCYAWLVHLHYPEYNIRTVIHYAHPKLNFYGAPYVWSQEDLEDIDSEIRTRIKTIEYMKNFPALPGAHCDYCHMSTNCPELLTIEKQNSRHEINTNVYSVEDMVRLAGKLRVLGVVYDNLNSVLKEKIEALCPENGIAIEGMWFGFRSSESVDWQATDKAIQDAVVHVRVKQERGEPLTDDDKTLLITKNLSGLLTGSGLNPDGFKDWKSDKMKALWKLDKPTLIEMLSKFAVREKSTRFGGYKH